MLEEGARLFGACERAFVLRWGAFMMAADQLEPQNPPGPPHLSQTRFQGLPQAPPTIQFTLLFFDFYFSGLSLGAFQRQKPRARTPR